MPASKHHLARVPGADLVAFVAAVLDDGGRLGRQLGVDDGYPAVEVFDLRHHEVLAAGASSAHPVTEPAPHEYRGRRVRQLKPVLKARQRRREQVADLGREMRALHDHAEEVSMYIDAIESGANFQWKALPPQVGWWLEGWEGRGPWDYREGRQWVVGVHDVLAERRRSRQVLTRPPTNDPTEDVPPLRLV